MATAIRHASRRPSTVIFGCLGYTLGSSERRFFQESNPYGFILHSRNCRDPKQLGELISELKEAVGRQNVNIFIDQEGGRISRLAPPHWRAVPSATQFLNVARTDLRRAAQAVHLNSRLVAAELRQLGITVNIAPVLDLPAPNAHKIIGDRAFGDTPEMVSFLGRAACEGLLHGGVLPVIKHILGHGRASVDRNEPLLVVDASLKEMDSFDFVPVRALHDMPWAMAAHVLYRKLDPEMRATASAPVIEGVIRSNIGFGGVLISDDVATLGPTHELARHVRETLEAGCDFVVHGNGDMDQMQAVAASLDQISEATRERLERAEAARHEPERLDIDKATARLDILLRTSRSTGADAPETRSGRVVADVVDKIERDIVFGRLLPRQRLMEDELVYGLGIKRHVARAAFQELARKGVITFEAYRGATIRHFSPEELNKLQDLQVTLHGAAANRLRHSTAGLLDRLDEAQQQFIEAIETGDLQQIHHADMVFHDVLAEGAGNEFLFDAIKNCDVLTHGVYVQSLRSRERLDLCRQEHETMIRAVRDNDPVLLAHLCTDHIVAAFEFYRTTVLGLQPPPAAWSH